MSFPVAYALRQRGSPLLFLTSAYEQRSLPKDLGDALLVEKPFSPPLLVEIVRRLAMVQAWPTMGARRPARPSRSTRGPQVLAKVCGFAHISPAGAVCDNEH